MSDLNQNLTAHYGSDETASPEAQAKLAQAQEDLFLKLASENGVNLRDLSDEQVVELWNRTFGADAEEKTASAPEAAPAVEEQARAEHDAAQAKLASDQAAYEFGLKQGEAVWAVFQKHAAEAGLFDLVKAAASGGFVPFQKKEDGEKSDDGDKGGKAPPFAKKEDKGEEKKDDKKDEKAEKKASAFDAHVRAVALGLAKQAGLEEHGLSLDVLAERLDAAAVLLPAGCPQSKVANARGSFEQMSTLRALELLEFAGVPVDWNG